VRSPELSLASPPPRQIMHITILSCVYRAGQEKRTLRHNFLLPGSPLVWYIRRMPETSTEPINRLQPRTIKVPEYIHRRAKAAAALQGLGVSRFTELALEAHLERWGHGLRLSAGHAHLGGPPSRSPEDASSNDQGDGSK
jgi:hypothetical protein